MEDEKNYEDGIIDLEDLLDKVYYLLEKSVDQSVWKAHFQIIQKCETQSEKLEALKILYSALGKEASQIETTITSYQFDPLQELRNKEKVYVAEMRSLLERRRQLQSTQHVYEAKKAFILASIKEQKVKSTDK